MTFKGRGSVWDPLNNRPLVSFARGGSFTTTDEREIDIMLKAGYKPEVRAEVQPARHIENSVDPSPYGELEAFAARLAVDRIVSIPEAAALIMAAFVEQERALANRAALEVARRSRKPGRRSA
jgi:hypothetical protein